MEVKFLVCNSLFFRTIIYYLVMFSSSVWVVYQRNFYFSILFLYIFDRSLLLILWRVKYELWMSWPWYDYTIFEMFCTAADCVTQRAYLIPEINIHFFIIHDIFVFLLSPCKHYPSKHFFYCFEADLIICVLRFMIKIFLESISRIEYWFHR